MCLRRCAAVQSLCRAPQLVFEFVRFPESLSSPIAPRLRRLAKLLELCNSLACFATLSARAFGEQTWSSFTGRAPPRNDIRQLLASAVLHDDTAIQFIDWPAAANRLAYSAVSTTLRRRSMRVATVD
jgi:hypothetical protein